MSVDITKFYTVTSDNMVLLFFFLNFYSKPCFNPKGSSSG